MTYILTYSGKRVSADAGVPTLEDIAVGLSRLPRFAGQGRHLWSVLDHSRFAEYLALHEDHLTATSRLDLRLHTLLHDAHEALTGDVPTPFKGGELRHLQRQLDLRIYATYAPLIPGGASLAGASRIERVRRIDHRCLLAEALVQGPPTLQTAEDVATHFGMAPRLTDVVLLREFEREAYACDEIEEYVRRVTDLQAQLRALHVH